MTDRSLPASDPLASALRRHLERTRLIPPTARVLVAVSGGLDSVVLLHLLRFRSPQLELHLTAAHFDHRMRDSAGDDASWVNGLCRAWDVALDSGRAGEPLRSEAEARRSRYEFLEAAATRCGADWIATAHQADDQAETVLFRLLRGTGLAGLAGIPARRGRFIRPLLPFPRSSLAAYARRCGLRHREDPTNLDPSFARNRLRHIVLPALRQAWPNVSGSLVRLAHEATQAETAWRTIARAAFGHVVRDRRDGQILLARDLLLGYHPHVRARILRLAFAEIGRAPGRAGTEAALAFITTGASGGAVELAHGLRLERHFDRLVVRRATSNLATVDRPLVIPEPKSGRGTARIGGRPCRIHWSAGASVATSSETFDAAALMFPLEVRSWRPGDRIRLEAGTKKLKKLFGERRVPRPDRPCVPILAERDGRVLWVAGLARAADLEPRPGEPVFGIRIDHGIDG